MLAGLNTDARLYLETSANLPNVGEEVVVNVDMADFVQMKGYGFTVAFDTEQIEFVRATTTNSLLGQGVRAPRTIAQLTVEWISLHMGTWSPKVNLAFAGFRTKLRSKIKRSRLPEVRLAM